MSAPLRLLRLLFRWKAIVPLVLLLVLLGGGWLLYLDTLVRRGVEEAGARVVGARVDVEAADVRLGEGSVRLRRIQVANPDAPMTNLVEAEDVVADFLIAPLLEKKVVVETLAVRGVRFGTPRTTSGALDRPSPATGRIYRDVSQWANRIRIPPLSLEGLRAVIDVDAISPDSLRTLQEARALRRRTDSLRTAWTDRLAALNPEPRIDSTAALVARLRSADPVRLGIPGLTSLAGSARATLTTFGEFRGRLGALDGAVRGGVDDLAGELSRLAEARRSDYAYARGLLKVPSLSGPDLSPALFGESALEWVKPLLYWMRVVEEYLPPGLRPSRYAGPSRARRPGTTVRFPSQDAFPKFLLAVGVLDLTLGGEGVQAGRYTARLTDLTSDPAIVRRPLTLEAERSEAARGPRQLRLAAVLDHVAAPIRDSVDVLVRGIGLPTVTVGSVGARLHLGDGATDLTFRRAGERISARWVWRSSTVRWERLGGRVGGQDPGVARPPDRPIGRPPSGAGAAAWAQDLLWRTVSALTEVEIEVGLGGTVSRPSLSVRSDVGDALAQSLRRELGREIEDAERRVRAEVDRLIEPQVTAARGAFDAVRSDVQERVAAHLEQARALEAQLQQELTRLTRGLPAGVRIP